MSTRDICNIYRWYRAGWGRYTQADPLGLNGGLNCFAYVDGNPVGLIDRIGMLPVSYTGAKNSAIKAICNRPGALGCAFFDGDRSCEWESDCGTWRPNASFTGSVRIYFSADCYDTGNIILEEERHLEQYEEDFKAAQK